MPPKIKPKKISKEKLPLPSPTKIVKVSIQGEEKTKKNGWLVWNE